MKIVKKTETVPIGEPVAIIPDVGNGTAINFVKAPKAVKLDILYLNTWAVMPQLVENV